MAEAPRLLIWDALAEHDWVPNTVSTIDDLCQFLKDSHGRGWFAVRLVPASLKEVDAFSRLAFCCYRTAVGFEEVPTFASASAMPRDFERLVLQGRHRGLDFVFTGQRFAEMPRTLTAQCDAFVLFGAGEPLDLAAVEARTSAEFRRAVQELPQYKALVYDLARRKQSPATPEVMARLLEA